MQYAHNKYLNFKNSHLIISLGIVVPTAIIYGVLTTTTLPKTFDLKIETIDSMSFFRAIMCLYLGISAIWLVGIVNPKFWRSATILNILFMASLAMGRIISLVIDGQPSSGYVFGMLAECVLAVYGFLQLRRYATKDT